MNYDTVWEIIAPWIAALGGITGICGIIVLIAKFIVSRMIKKNSKMLGSLFNTDNIAQSVANQLAGKTIDIDVTAVTEKSLGKLTRRLDARIEKVEDTASALSGILVPMGKAIAKLKALTDDERAELTAAIQVLEKGYTPPDMDEKMTVVLTPVALPENTETDDEEDEEDGETGLNFGDLEG